jgi:hypothetical protein
MTPGASYSAGIYGLAAAHCVFRLAHRELRIKAVHLGCRIVHPEHGVGQALGGIGNRGEYRAAEHGKNQQPDTPPTKLSAKMQHERHEPIGKQGRVHCLDILYLSSGVGGRPNPPDPASGGLTCKAPICL